MSDHFPVAQKGHKGSFEEFPVFSTESVETWGIKVDSQIKQIGLPWRSENDIGGFQENNFLLIFILTLYFI